MRLFDLENKYIEYVCLSMLIFAFIPLADLLFETGKVDLIYHNMH